MKFLNKKTLAVILILALAIGVGYALTNTSQPPIENPPNNTTPTPTPNETPTGPQPYATAENLSLQDIQNNTLTSHTIYLETNTTDSDTTRYYYYNNTTNQSVIAYYNDTYAYSQMRNDTQYQNVTHEIMDNGTVQSRFHSQALPADVPTFNAKENITQHLKNNLQSQPLEVTNFNQTADPMLTTYTLQNDNTLTVNEYGQITELHTSQTTLTIEYNTTAPQSPPRPQQQINNTTSTETNTTNNTTTTPTESE